MILTYMLGKMIGRFAMMLPLLRMGIKQMKMAQKQMREFAEQNQAQNPYNQPGQAGEKMSKEDFKRAQADRMAAMMKSEQEHIDQMLRDQGIDIDSLDEQFGTELDSFEKSTTLNVDKYDVKEGTVYEAQNHDGETIDVEVVESRDH